MQMRQLKFVTWCQHKKLMLKGQEGTRLGHIGYYKLKVMVMKSMLIGTSRYMWRHCLCILPIRKSPSTFIQGIKVHSQGAFWSISPRCVFSLIKEPSVSDIRYMIIFIDDFS